MIKFPAKHYVGFQKRKTDILLGFMTPYGEDSAAKKRISTVDSWSKRYNQIYDPDTKSYVDVDPIPPVIYDNAVLNGFYIGNSINHSSSWNSCRDKWRVEDPRGFELEITSGNLEEIFKTCTIINGKIQEDCIWARLGAQNVLVPVNNKLYIEATKNTEISKVSAKISDAKPGYKVTLQNGKVGYYIGHYYHIIESSRYGSHPTKVYVSDRKRHIFRDAKNEDAFFSFSDPKPALIEPREILENPIDYVNSLEKLDIYHSTEYGIIGISNTKDVKFSQKLIECVEFTAGCYAKIEYEGKDRYYYISPYMKSNSEFIERYATDSYFNSELELISSQHHRYLNTEKIKIPLNVKKYQFQLTYEFDQYKYNHILKY